MATHFDIRTLAAVTATLAAFFAVALFAFGATQRKFKGFGVLATGSALCSFGICLVDRRGSWPDYLTVVVANTAILAGTASFYEGTRRFLTGSCRPRLISVLLVLGTPAVFPYFTYVTPSISARIILFSTTSLIFMILATVEMVRHKCKEGCQLPQFTTLLTFTLYGLFQVFRIVGTLKSGHIDSFLSAGYVHAFAFIFSIVLLVGILFGFFWMVTQSLVDDLRDLATHDSLTSVLNRRGVEFLSDQLYAKRRRQNGRLATVLLDIDHFKQVNDRFGHGGGDQVLADFASLLKQNTRESDIFGRIGGEEFVLLLPDADLASAMAFAERLRSEVEDHEFVVDQTPIRITASFGVTDHFPADATLDSSVMLADKALYRSKETGRNRVSSHNPA